MVESFLFFSRLFVTLLLPLVLLSFEPLLEPRVVEMLLLFFIVLSFDAVIDVVILVESLML